MAASFGRDFPLLSAGTFFSNIAQQVMAVAIAWELYAQTRSPLVLGNVGLAQVAPVLLFALVAGQVADHVSRRRVILAAQTAAVAVATVLWLAPAPRPVWLVYACLTVIGTARTFQSPSATSLLPTLLPAERLAQGIAWHSGAQQGALLLGPLLGGWLLAQFAPGAAYATQAATGALALLLFLGLRPAPAATTGTERPTWHTVGEGARFVWRDRLVFSALLLDLLAVLLGGAVALLPVFAEDILHVGAAGLGWLRMASAAGACAMTLVLGAAGPLRRAGPSLLWAVAGFGVATVVFGLSRSFALSFVMLLLAGALDYISVVLRMLLVQVRTPDAIRGRVVAVNSLFIACSNQLSAVESGIVAEWMGPVPAVVWGGVGTLVVVAVMAAAFPELRRWRQS